jgi:hypothetical protein
MRICQGLGCVRSPGTLFEESLSIEEHFPVETSLPDAESDPFLEIECLLQWLDLNA